MDVERVMKVHSSTPAFLHENLTEHLQVLVLLDQPPCLNLFVSFVYGCQYPSPGVINIIMYYVVLFMNQLFAASCVPYISSQISL